MRFRNRSATIVCLEESRVLLTFLDDQTKGWHARDELLEHGTILVE